MNLRVLSLVILSILSIFLFSCAKSIVEEEQVVPNDYSFKFNTNGGNIINSFTIKSQYSLRLPIPKKDNYTFVGWYYDIELTNEFDVLFLEPGNTTLHAKWEPNKVLGPNERSLVCNRSYDDLTFIYDSEITTFTIDNGGRFKIESPYEMNNAISSMISENAISSIEEYMLTLDNSLELIGWDCIHTGNDLDFTTINTQYSNEDSPLSQYTDDTKNLDVFEELLEVAISNLQNGSSDDLDFSITFEDLNVLLYQSIINNINPSYAPFGTCIDSDCNQISSTKTNILDPSPITSYDFWLEHLENDTILATMLLSKHENDHELFYKVEFIIIVNSINGNTTFKIDDIWINDVNIPSELNTPGNVIYSFLDFRLLFDGIVYNDSIDIYSFSLYETINSLFNISTNNDSLESILTNIHTNTIADNQLFQIDIDDPITFRFWSEAFIDDGYFGPSPSEINTNNETLGNYLILDLLFNSSLTDENNNVFITESIINQLILNEMQPEFNNPHGLFEFQLSELWVDISPEDLDIHMIVNWGDLRVSYKFTFEVISDNYGSVIYQLTSFSIGEDEGDTELEYLTINDLEAASDILSYLDLPWLITEEHQSLTLNFDPFYVYSYDELVISDEFKIVAHTISENYISYEIEAKLDYMADIFEQAKQETGDTFADGSLSEAMLALNAEETERFSAIISTIDMIQIEFVTYDVVSQSHVQELLDELVLLSIDDQLLFFDTFESTLDPTSASDLFDLILSNE